MKSVSDQLIQRQKDIEAGKFRRLLLNPEGINTNNTYLLPFKVGGFLSLLPVEPYYQKVSCAGPDCFTTSIPIAALFILSLTSLYNQHTGYKFPQFIPNDYLFDIHADKGKNKAEIFAWAVRDVMAKEMKVEKWDSPDPYNECR